MPRRLPFGRLVLALLAGYAAAAGASAQGSRATGFDLVRLDPSPRAAALAGADAPPGEDPSALYYNPALLGAGMDRQAAVGYTNLVAGIASGHLTYARDVPRLGGTLGGGVRYLSYGPFDRAETGGPGEGTFRAGETALTLAYARSLSERLSVGASAHALSARIDEAQAAALTLALGASLDLPDRRTTIGASVHHLGLALSSIGAERDRLPLDVRLSATRRLAYLPLTIAVTGYDLGSWGQADSSAVREVLHHLALGGELQLGPALALRGGYHPRRADALRGGPRLDLAGVSLGFGLGLRRVGLDYAYTGWSRFGGQHQFGVRTRL